MASQWWEQYPLNNPISASVRPASKKLTSLTVLFRLLGLAWPFAGLIALSMLLGFATTGSGIGLMAASAYIISAAALHPSVAVLQVAIVGVRFFGITRGLFRYLERYTSHQVTFRLLARLRVWFYRALEPLAPARLQAYRTGDLLTRMIGDIAALENFYVRVIAPPLAALLVSLVMVIFMYSFDESLAWALLCFLILGGIGIPLLMHLLGKKTGQQLVESRGELSSALVDGIQGLPDLLVLGQAQSQLDSILQDNQLLENAQRRMANYAGIQSALSGLTASLGMLAVLTLAAPLVSSGRLPGVYLTVVVLAALASFEAVQPLPLAAQYLENSLAAARRLYEIVDAQPQVKPPTTALPFPGNFDLEVKDLSFTYPSPVENLRLSFQGTGCTTLEHIDFSLPEGKHMAVVGPTGAGKSTLVNLLLRFWDYEGGSILLDKQDLRRFDPQDLRERIGVVAQSTYLFNATVRENILLGKPRATQPQVEQAARQAQIHDFILGLPQGYDTWVGERGVRLSAGERQRVAIARALLKEAPFLILDEPTANLDTVNERRVLESIHALMKGRTSLMITHRLVGMEWMDEILVLQNGRIAERGTHAGLLEAHGLYRRMWDLQSQVLV
jgi:ATP-binding cassette subfamily C protein CydC